MPAAPRIGRVGRMAIAAVLKTAVRKDFWVRIPGPPLHAGTQTTTDDPTATMLAVSAGQWWRSID